MTIRDLPRPIRALLSIGLPGDWRDDIVRDLEEAWTRRVSSTGRIRATMWLTLEALAFTLRFGPTRIRELLEAGLRSSTDLRLALRASARAPFVTMLTLLSLTTGIFAALTGWTWIVGSMFSDLPFEGGDRIVLVEDYNLTGRHSISVSPEEFRRRRTELGSFEYLSAFVQQNVVIGEEADTREVRQALLASWDFLHMTGVAPLLGRLPAQDDVRPGAPPVIVLPHAAWVTFGGASPEVIGQPIEVGGIRRTVIGVMPEGFGFPWSDDLWIPVDVRDVEGSLRLVGKMKSDVDLSAARVEAAAVSRPDPAMTQAGDVVEHVVAGVTRPMVNDSEVFVLAAPIAVLVLILLVMATNVANLMLARNARRSTELAIRGALGASRTRVVGQLVAEVAVLVVIAAGLGTWASQYAIGLFTTRVDLPFFTDYSLDATALLFVGALSLLVTFVAGVAPARRATGRSPGDALRDGGRGAAGVRFGRLTGTLIVAQVAICVGFLSAATLLGQSLMSYTFERYGLPAEETLVAQLYFGFPRELNDPTTGLSDDERQAQQLSFMEEATRKRELIADAAAMIEGVRMTAYGSRFPGNESDQLRIEVEHSDEPIERVESAEAGPGYFDLVDAGPVQGRLFEAGEFTREARVVLVNEPFVRERLQGANAIGRRIRVFAADSERDENAPWSTIVGVVPDLGLNPGNPDRSAAVYRPLPETNVVRMALRGDGDPGLWTPQLVEVIRRVDPDIRVQWSRTLADQMNQPVAIFRGMGAAFLALGALALILSAASIHALTGVTVTRRTRELGIRQALGASRGSIVHAVLSRTALQLIVGSICGAALAALLLRLAVVMPWEIRQGNPAALAIVVGALALAGTTALAQPLGRALAIRPADAMRAE
ncbi:MAG: ABC transporter permease [Gemmatimonadota bacterium]